MARTMKRLSRAKSTMARIIGQSFLLGNHSSGFYCSTVLCITSALLTTCWPGSMP